MIKFTKAHAYGNDFLYVERPAAAGLALDALARELCDRHTGIGADGLIVYERAGDEASMRLFNADGSRAEVSGNGVRALGALLLHGDQGANRTITVHTEAGSKQLNRIGRSGSRQTFRAAMGQPTNLRQMPIAVGDESFNVTVMSMGNPQCVILGALPDRLRFSQLGAALEHHRLFPEGTNIEFAEVEKQDRIRIVIWERGVGPTASSGTGSCAALVAAAAFGGAAREADVIAPGGSQRVEWCDEGIYLTGWAEVLFEGEWLR